MFRESKIHDAVLFFDECESIFMDRTKGNMQARDVIVRSCIHYEFIILEKYESIFMDRTKGNMQVNTVL